jgi:hypothetical protein
MMNAMSLLWLQVPVPEVKLPNKTEVVVPVVKAEPAVKHVNVSEVLRFFSPFPPPASRRPPLPSRALNILHMLHFLLDCSSTLHAALLCGRIGRPAQRASSTVLSSQS